jgi:carbon storage regulator CsrA
MLVLTRREGERLVFTHGGVTFTLQVTDVKRASGQVKLAIDAPPEVVVRREELVRREAA